jgi:hypothetical protein
MPQVIADDNEELGGDLDLVLELGWLEAVDTQEDFASGVIHRMS